MHININVLLPYDLETENKLSQITFGHYDYEKKEVNYAF